MSKAKSQHISEDYSHLYWESTQETLVGLYGKRDTKTGQPIETINDIIWRVALANAIAELKYVLTPQEIIDINIDEAVKQTKVLHWTKIFADNIGKQKFWANTPGNINADPNISLKVLKYWAHGKLLGLAEDQIWLISNQLRNAYEEMNKYVKLGRKIEHALSDHELAMGKLASELKGKGCLAACGVAYVIDTLEGIQEAAKTEALAAKAAMGMGLNTSSLRPWSSIIGNGAAASGPDRFYEKTIAKAVEAVAQGGRRGGALIELRNSNHPDILFFIEKKKLMPPPSLAHTYKELSEKLKQRPNENRMDYKRRLLFESEQAYGRKFAQYIERQNYLKNTNVTVLAMPGFMEAVKAKAFYPAVFEGKTWTGSIYDPERQVMDEKTGQPLINKLTKEFFYHEYAVSLEKYPDALLAARQLDNVQVEINDNYVSVKSHFYAPDIFNRIVEGMRTSGEPGLAFYEHVNNANANNHIYDLDTCNPCGEQFLPAGPGHDGRIYMGTCNLSSMHAAHKDFFEKNGNYNMASMKAIAKIMQRFMDNVSDVSWYPIPEQNMTSRMERRNGGGFAGIAEYLSRRELEFGSKEANSAIAELFAEYNQASIEASIELANERGVYPLWEGSRFAKKGLRVRNACMTNNAPTGTLAQALQTSWGVDPHNGIVFSRKVRSRMVDFVAPGFRELMIKYNAWPETEAEQNILMQKIRDNHKSCRGIDAVPEAVQKAFPIRVEIEPVDYIKHLAAVHDGAHVYPEAFNSVSNTCSIPLDMSREAIYNATILAWELGVKDITFYPDGSRLSQPVEQIAKETYKKESTDLLTLIGHQEARTINVDETTGSTYKVKVGSPSGGSTLHVSLNHDGNHPGELIEVYARMGKPGAIEAGLFEAVGRLASAFLQYAAKFGEAEREQAEHVIVQQLINIQSGYPAFFKFADSEKAIVIQSPCDGLAKAILQYREQYAPLVQKIKKNLQALSNMSESNVSDVSDASVFGINASSVPASSKLDAIALSKIIYEADQAPQDCGTCGSTDWLKIDGCWVCQSCGYSKCG
jgi:ribonucleotide reductase alpha subunit/rubredoxin